MYYYEVAPTRIVRSGQDSLTYHSDKKLKIGAIVLIPVGKISLVGVVISAGDKPAYATKPIDQLLYDTPLPAPLVTSLVWLGQYYATPLATVLQSALPAGLTKKRRQVAKSTTVAERDRTNFVLNKQQLQAIQTITESKSITTMLHGITGSGKTAIYIELAKQAVSRGQSVMIIVPEIALTAQLVASFAPEFESTIVAHSGQTESERHQIWQKVLSSDQPQLIIGPRSALFLPAKNIGLVVIDEAHESSLKQDSSPRYSALRLATILASHHKAKAVQGSATPLIAEYYLAHQTGSIIRLDQKAIPDSTKPDIQLVDMTKRGNFNKSKFLSSQLITAVAEAIAHGQQSLIFHNRRGSASFTLCGSCGWSASCPNCYLPLTLHADIHKLRCHICGYTAKVPTACPVCQSTDILHKGIGTKLIETELAHIFPEARIARFDADTRPGDTVDQRYQELYDGKIDIIIGTQVVAKGLDLPKLSVVGVVQADTGLTLPDYTSSERTFQLLYQVIGRVGRSSLPSKIIVQSYQPDSPTIRYGIDQDYGKFYDLTIKDRHRADFPPFCYIAKLYGTYKTEAIAIKNSRALAATIARNHPEVTILGPTPAFHERPGGSYRWQIVIKSAKRAQLVEIINRHLPKTHWQFDIDPYNLL